MSGRTGAPLPGRRFVLVSNAHNLIFSTGEPAYAVDSSGRILAWNKAAERAFGYTQATALGASCWELLQGRDIFGNQYCGRRCPHREMAARAKPINRCRMHFRLASGEIRQFLLSTLAFQEQSGRSILIHLCKPEATRTGGELGNGASCGSSILTERETEVLSHLADGHSTPEIAVALSISTSTVRNHVEHILVKLDCHSRLEAVALARKQQLI